MSALRVISLGAGVQSTALALMAAHGEIGPMPDCAIFADTGDEKRATYRHIDWLATKLSFPLIRVSRFHGSLSSNTLAHYHNGSGARITPPFFFPGGMLPKECSKEWKTRAVTREIRRQLGLSYGERAPAGTEVEVWIGISREEAHRIKASEVPWITNRWPLVDRNIRRSGCAAWLVEHGYPIPPRSACVYCPFQSDAEFEEIKANEQDDDWSRVVEFDRAIRPGGNRTFGPLYISVHRKPIEDVAFGLEPDLFGNECEGMCGV